MEEFYYPSSENKGADQLYSYCTAIFILYVFANAEIWFSPDAADMFLLKLTLYFH